MTREEFFEEHGEHVRLNGFYVFEDGAMTEENPMGQFCEPPDDDYERTKLIAQFCKAKALRAEEEFTAYQNYLNGTGFRKDEWAQDFTDDEKLDRLRKLQRRAKTAAAKYRHTLREADELMPEELRDAEDADIQESSRRHAFQEAVDEITI